MDKTQTDTIEGEIGQMSLPEEKRLFVVIQNSIKHELDGGNGKEARDGKPHVCLRCGCPKTTKDYYRGRQRYLCHGCGRTFDGTTGKVLTTSRLPASCWLAYAECMVDGLTLRAAAEKRGVGLKTSLLVRHRVCECMGRYLLAFEVDPGCAAEMDETFFHESSEGNHKNNPGFRVSRRVRTRGRDGVKRGISADQACGRGCNRVHRPPVPLCRRPQARRCGGLCLGTTDIVNSPHSRLDAFLARVRGVATRRLHDYLV